MSSTSWLDVEDSVTDGVAGDSVPSTEGSLDSRDGAGSAASNTSIMIVGRDSAATSVATSAATASLAFRCETGTEMPSTATRDKNRNVILIFCFLPKNELERNARRRVIVGYFLETRIGVG